MVTLLTQALIEKDIEAPELLSRKHAGCGPIMIMLQPAD